MSRDPTAEELIVLLGLRRHPEGGWFRQTFIDDAGGGRAHSTAIYYLLQAGERSHWHRVDAAEVWHWYAGAALELCLSEDGFNIATEILGPDLGAGQRPQAIVPAGVWQAAMPLGAYVLCGCTVAPGFSFDGFELAPPGWSPGR